MAAPYAPTRELSPGEVLPEVVVDDAPQEWQEDLNVIFMCPDCRENPPNLVEEFSSGDTVCGSCGRVLADRIIDTRSEWRTFSNDDQGGDDPSRVGDAANPLLHGSQLQTDIAFADGAMSMRVKELTRAQNKSNHDRTNKTLQNAYSQVSTLCEASNIPKPVAEQAKFLYRITEDAKILKGKSQDAIIAGCIFIACRQHGVARTFREIFKLTNVSKKEIGRTFKVLQQYLDKKDKNVMPSSLAGVIENNTFKSTKSADPSELVGRACNKLNLSTPIALMAADAAARITAQGVAAGRSPLSITGATVYLISHLMGQPRSPKEIGAAVDVSDGTIRTAYKLIYSALDKVMNEDWIRRGGDRSRIPAAKKKSLKVQDKENMPVDLDGLREVWSSQVNR